MFIKLTGFVSNQPVIIEISKISAIYGVATDANIFVKSEIIIDGYDTTITVKETPELIMQTIALYEGDDRKC